MAIMTHARFHFNRLTVTLIFGVRVSESGGIRIPLECLFDPSVT